MNNLQELTPELYKDMIEEVERDEFEEGAQNRFRNNDYRSFEEWLNDKEE